MTEKVENARARLLLIHAQDKDATRLTDRLDAESMLVMVEEFDALRAKLAEVETAVRPLVERAVREGMAEADDAARAWAVGVHRSDVPLNTIVARVLGEGKP